MSIYIGLGVLCWDPPMEKPSTEKTPMRISANLPDQPQDTSQKTLLGSIPKISETMSQALFKI